MIKLFRNIRKKIVSEKPSANRTANYLKYAIGEIVLVVIGILVALQLNIWNEQQKTQQESKEFIGRLLDEVRINIAQADSEILVETKQLNSSKKILDLFHEKVENVKATTFDSLVFTIYSTNTVNINTGTLIEGQNTGKIALIKSDSLRLALYNFPTIIEEIRRQEQIDSDDLNNVFAIFLNENYNYRNMDNRYSAYKGVIGETKFNSFNNLNLLNNMKFENLIDNRFYQNNFQMSDLQSLKKELEKIERLILEELNHDKTL